MKKGIIIIFRKNDTDITNTLIFKSFFNQKIKICLVNNGNHEDVFKLLSELKESSESDVSILNLRKEKTLKVAVKAGVRFLSNNGNIKLIIHAEPNNIANPIFIDKILEFFTQDITAKKNERVLLRRVYSVNEMSNYKRKLL